MNREKVMLGWIMRPTSTLPGQSAAKNCSRNSPDFVVAIVPCRDGWKDRKEAPGILSKFL